MSFCRQNKDKRISKPFPKTVAQHSLDGKKTPLCTLFCGSYTLEAAVVFPLLAGFFVSILFFFRVLQVQTQVQEALYYAGRKTACEASVTDSAGALRAVAEAYFRKEVRTYEVPGKFIKGGSGGISLLRSRFSGSEITLCADYEVRLPIGFFAVKGMSVSQSSGSRKWTGDASEGNQTDYVYVTAYGKVYHKSRSCPYLDLSIRGVISAKITGLRNKGGHKYYACPDCVAKNKKNQTVYITDYGTCYHNSLSCSGLKRTVSLVPLTEVGGRNCCKRCGSGG